MGRASEKRIKQSRPFNGKENYDRVGFVDRLQDHSMLPYHATNRKLARAKHESSWTQKENSSC